MQSTHRLLAPCDHNFPLFTNSGDGLNPKTMSHIRPDVYTWDMRMCNEHFAKKLKLFRDG